MSSPNLVLAQSLRKYNARIGYGDCKRHTKDPP